jgi:hypothetical protein
MIRAPLAIATEKAIARAYVMIAPVTAPALRSTSSAKSYLGKIAARSGNRRHGNFDGACDIFATKEAERPPVSFFLADLALPIS